MSWQSVKHRTISECIAPGLANPLPRLVAYLSREDAMKSLLGWVVSGLDELDQQALEADTASFHHVFSSLDLYPSYRSLRVPGPGPNSPPMEPAKMVDEVKEEVLPGGVSMEGGFDRQKSSEDSRSRLVARKQT